MELQRSISNQTYSSINNQTVFSIKLATHLLSKKFQNSNVVFSPISIHVVLSLLAAGSNGETLDQLLAFLKTTTADELNSLYLQLVPLILADGSQTRGPRLTFANGVWVDKTLSLKPCFKQVADTVYKAACNQVDFQTKAVEVADEVNSWAEKQSNDQIKQLLPADSVNEFTRLIFANAVYFKGSWRQKFNQSKTKESDFHLLDGSQVRVPFMTSNSDQIVRQHNDFTVLGLRYLKDLHDQRQFTMYIFLPNAKDGLPSLIEKIGSSSSTYDFFNSCIPIRSERADVGEFLIPKFKISFGFEASDMLKELGLVLPFGGTESSVVGEEDVYVSSIHHKSFVEVNEGGTEAAAISVMEKEYYYRHKLKKVDFVADHPFLFVIREDVSGVLLFMGQVINPVA